MFSIENNQILNIIYAFALEAVFLLFCIILIGLGVSEIKKQRAVVGHALLVSFGIGLIFVSFYVTKLLIER